jgi:hypothetical protein
MYGQSIALALPEANPADHAEIENIMRDLILHSELDWVTTGLFRDTAQLAYEVLLAMRTQPRRSTEVPGKQKRRK